MLILIIFLSHLIADFGFQSYKMAEEKENSYKTAILHALVHFSVAVVVLLICYVFTRGFYLLNEYSLIAITLVSITHFLVDKFGKKLLKKLLNNNDFFVFIVDQLFHFIIIYAVVFLIDPYYNSNGIFVNIINNRSLVIILSLSILLILLTSFTGHLIAKLFKSLNHKHNIDSTEEVKVVEKTINNETEVITEKIKFPVEVNDYGKWIGYCERIIIFLLVVMQVYEGIAIIVALKTFARYQQLNQKSFVEKYLLGTLFSVMMAILLGLLFRPFGRIL